MDKLPTLRGHAKNTGLSIPEQARPSHFIRALVVAATACEHF
jgi:hypothetical protein